MDRRVKGGGLAVKAVLNVAALWLLAAALWLTGAFEFIENRLYDTLYQRDGAPDTRVVIIGIDESSIAALGQWPWPRDYMADVIDILAEGGAAAVGIDVLYDTPARNPQEDAALARAATNAGNVILPVQGLFQRRTTSVYNGYVEASGLLTPVESLRGAALAHVNAQNDSDGVVRRALSGLAYDGTIYPSFSLALYETFLARTGGENLAAALPVDKAGLYYIEYTGRSGRYRPVSFADVREGKVPPRYFKDKIVLIGLYATGVANDWQFTSIDTERATYGVEIHANMVQQLLEGRYIKPLHPAAGFGVFFLFTALSALLSIRLRPLWGLAALAGLLAAYCGAVWLFVSAGLVTKLIYTPLFCVAAYFDSLAWHYSRTRASEALVRDTFGKYMAPDVIKKILEDGQDGLRLGGQRRDITVLFADVRGFTPLSESAEPEEVVSLLNVHLDIAATCIHRHGGTLDKFMGDAVMAMWNAPYDTPDSALQAVRAALDIQRATPPGSVSFGIGVNSGEAVIGNIGAHFRMDYTAIGDTVNTAARLEANAKPGQVLVSLATARRLENSDVTVNRVGELKLKGKAEPAEVFEALYLPSK
jgi:adenylate cyclase